MPNTLPENTSPPLVWAEINLCALQANISYLKQLSNECFFIMVIKANAYGHGMMDVAKHLDGNTSVDAFAVARIDEAVQLRSQGIKKRIIVLSGVLTANDLNLCATYKVEAALHNTETVNLWLEHLQPYSSQNKQNSPCKAWLKINTGMNRLGISLDELAECVASINAISPASTENMLGIITHFSSSEEPENPQNNRQKLAFNEAISSSLFTQYFPDAKLCMSNSGGIIFHSDSHFDAVRSGLSCYGIAPTNNAEISKHLKPVMQLKARIIAIHSLKAGDTVGYNEQYTAQSPSTIATVAIGYGDGYPRNAANDTAVYVNGHKAKIAGRVSMDLMGIDVTHCSASVNDEVELWGEHISCNELATQCNTISYELLTRVTQRVPRILIK